MVLSILVIGVCGVLSQSYQQTQASQSNATGVLLAQQLADEIASKPMADPTTGSTTLGPDTGMTTRATFTRATNYDGYTDTSTALPLLAGGSMNVTNPQNFPGNFVYTRSVLPLSGATSMVGAKVMCNGTLYDTLSPTTNFAIFTVTVTCPDGNSVSIPGFTANYSVQR